MNQQQRLNDYLAKAQEAEERAANARDDQDRQAWLKIAASYRDLARGDRYPN